MKQRLTARQLQAWVNFTYALRWHGLAEHCRFGARGTGIEDNMLIVPCDDDIEKAIQACPAFGRKDAIYLKSDHPGAYASYRELTTIWSMHLCLLLRDGKRFLGVDCDMGRPFMDVAGEVVHIGEFLWHKIARTTVNPFQVCKAWNKRGMGIPEVKSVMDEDQVNA